jgi:ParB family transcriptional regulator, chromosome partitioning protein
MSKQRGGLGRGLGALIPGGEADSHPQGVGTGLTMAPVTAISPNPHQPRTEFDAKGLAELADSITEHGLIQPLIVTHSGNGRYTLIAGERRWRAAQMAGLTELPVVIKEATPQAMLELALIENIQRADLNVLEEALAYRQLIEEFNLTQDQVAQRVGRSRPAVANSVRLLDLPSNIQKAVVDGRISGTHARTLLPLPTPEQQTAVMNAIIQQELSVRQTEAVVRKMLAGQRPSPRPARTLPADLLALQSRFQESLGARVSIQKGPAGGKVVIHFYSDEELQTIYETIVGEEQP